MNKKLCSFGCGRPAVKQFKNGKYCCCNSTNSCPAVKNRVQQSMDYSSVSNKASAFDNQSNLKCSFGCDSIATHAYKTGSLCCCDDWHRCPGQKEHLSQLNTEKMKNMETRLKISIANKNQDLTPKPTKIKNSKNNTILCEYGCNQKAKYVFKNGKYCCSDRVERCPHQSNLISIRVKEYWKDEDFVKKVTSWERTEQYRKNVSNATKGIKKNFTEDGKKRMIEACKRKLEDRVGHDRAVQIKEHMRMLRLNHTWVELFGEERAKEIIQKSLETYRINGYSPSIETREIMRIKKKEHWQDKDSKYYSVEYREAKRDEIKINLLNFMKKQGPNKPEQIILNIFKELDLDYEFVGDFTFWIEHKNPDFINRSNNKIIEFFGLHWHGEEMTGEANNIHAQKRIDHFNKNGYECMVIWESELQNIENLKKNIIEFDREKF